MGISTHILDTSRGRPAARVSVTLHQLHRGATGDCWQEVSRCITDEDGRCKALLGDTVLVATDYRLEFYVQDYFQSLQVASIYVRIPILFRVEDGSQHYHIPLLLTANGYTTYRGS